MNRPRITKVVHEFEGGNLTWTLQGNKWTGSGEVLGFPITCEMESCRHYPGIIDTYEAIEQTLSGKEAT